jgi:hypothetical protein
MANLEIKKGNGETAALFVFYVMGASSLYSAFNPSWFTVSSDFFHGQGSKAGNIKRVRAGSIAATLLVIGSGIGLSYITSNPLFIYSGIIISAFFVAGYEWMIRHPAREDSNKTTYYWRL